jgi:predicted O-methyltransferase YrrM
MEPELFEMLSALELRDEKERRQNLPPAERIRALHPDAAKLVSMLAVSKKAQNIVEVGSGVGYSTLWLAYAASLVGGKVITCEIDPAKAAETWTNLQKANMAHYVEVLTGDARDLLRQRAEPVDFLFIDAVKSQYETYFDVVYKRMGVGAMIVADNATSHGDELLDYITYVQNHPNLESVTVPLARGLEISVKIAE